LIYKCNYFSYKLDHNGQRIRVAVSGDVVMLGWPTPAYSSTEFRTL
jgi:hypothetical protein